MTRETTVNGDTRRMRLDIAGDCVEARWGDSEMVLDVRAVEPGIYHVLQNGRSVTVVMGDHGSVQAGGRLFQVEVVDPRNAAAGNGTGVRAGQVKIAAPMPGKVIRVLVSAGDAVAAGQGLLVVEAMKMQNEMKAPRDATVVQVNAQETATVSAGEILMILE